MKQKGTLYKLVYGFRKAFALLPSKKDKMNVYVLWGGCLLNYVISMLQPTLQMWITDGAASLTHDVPNYRLLILSAVIMISTILLSYYMRKEMNAWSNNVSTIISDSITGEMMKKSARIKYAYFEDENTYNEINNISSNVPSKIANLLTWSTVPPILGGILSLIFTFFTLCQVNVFVAILVAIGNVLSIFFYGKRVKNNYFLKKEQIPQTRWANTYENTLSDRSTQKEVKLFALYDFLYEKWHRFSYDMAKANFSFSLKYTTLQFLSEFVAITFKIIALALTLVLIIQNKVSVGSFVLVYGTISVFNSYMSDISRAFINLGENGRYIDDWIKYMNLEEENTLLVNKVSKNSTIEFKNVSFNYPGSEKKVLDNLNVTINKGEHIAIVGENGSGKSTFVSLIMGMYDSYTGEILVGEQSPRLAAKNIRKKISCLFQDYNSYEISIEENVKIGDIHSAVSEEQIFEALFSAEAFDFVSKNSAGIHEYIGRFNKGISDLSGGQWQKIAIARALVKKDANIIILDEPTAALDPKSESKIYREFLKKYKNRTAILISHRLGATTKADRILVFSEGRIVETGTHSQLMELNGKYREMYEAQSKWYR